MSCHTVLARGTNRLRRLLELPLGFVQRSCEGLRPGLPCPGFVEDPSVRRLPNTHRPFRRVRNFTEANDGAWRRSPGYGGPACRHATVQNQARAKPGAFFLVMMPNREKHETIVCTMIRNST